MYYLLGTSKICSNSRKQIPEIFQNSQMVIGEEGGGGEGSKFAQAGDNKYQIIRYLHLILFV